jgi:AraC-like DNA-binding protein
VEYGLRADALWLDQATAALPLRSADCKLSAILLRYADSLLAAAPGGVRFVELAHHAITRALSSGTVSVAKAAAHLGISARTFQRRLRSVKTSHRDLLDQTRYDLASAYLSDPSVSITALSFMLDFADVSAFTRAFKRWSGLTPTAFRQRYGSRARGAAAAMAAKCARERQKSRHATA